MFPVRCVVECVNDTDCVKCSDHGSTLVDSFAIVAGQTPLSQLVETVLSALGFSHLAFAAKAWIQIRNWKPLSFDQITDDPDTEIDHILKDVSNQMTLRILTKQSDATVNDCVRDMKDRLLKVALEKAPKLLQEASAFRPQLKDFIMQLLQSDTPSLFDSEQTQQFNLWLDEYSQTNDRITSTRNGLTNGTETRSNEHRNGSSWQNRHQMANNPTLGAARFSQMLETPKLERWFRENANPSRQRLQYYMQILNASNYRKHAGKITYQQICNWFSNARASHRKRDRGRRSNSNSNSVVRGDEQSRSDNGSANHWVNKVFSNNVRNLSMAFNDFIQSNASSNKLKSDFTTSDGVVSLNVTDSPPNANHGQSDRIRAVSISPSSEPTSSVSHSPGCRSGRRSRDVSVNAIMVKEEDDEDMHSGMRIVMDDMQDESIGAEPSSSPIAIGATLKALDSLATMSTPTRSTQATSSASTFSSASSGNRTRLMFDPLTELPMLEKWFEDNPHPSWAQVDEFTRELNSLSYRQTYPPVTSHNLKIWFKNRRAKCKRLINGAGNDAATSASSVRGHI